ncbi:hypothetical protein L3Q72_11815 [Vibrio sp. JC009]|uniref:DUF7793 family protein n=1 Tax=Vibrio sp. JC009 TaxID=2912314 RepID=UPI0023AF4767|nr:STAS/SEC14 domain-containing protein [Vibrio sp. JC009]WED21318.1 hypothetical protein L3Q72_11815 [Vibrio sp. JC009]
MKIHGSHHIEISNDIITLELIGDFNEYGMSSALKSVSEAIEKLSGKNYCILVDSSRYTGGVPDAYEEVNLFYETGDITGLSAVAIVHSNNLLAIIDSRYIPSLEKQQVKTFSDKKSALCWLNSMRKP